MAQQHFVPGVTSASLLPPHPTSAAPQFFKNSKLRRGKWTAEEERYASFLIKEFELGSLSDCENGCTLRAYISRKLHCAPMRISKKFAGKSIGKHVFLSRSSGSNMGPSIQERNERMKKLRELEEQFYNSLIREGSGIAMDPSCAMPPTLMSHSIHPFGSTSQPYTLAQGPLFQGLVLNGSGAVPAPYPAGPVMPVQTSSATHVTSWPMLGAPQQIGIGSNISNATSAVANQDHAKQLEQSFLKAMHQVPHKESETNKFNENGNLNLYKSLPATSMAVTAAAASEAENVGAAKEMDDMLSGFDNQAASASNGIHSSSNHLPPVPLWPSEYSGGPSSLSFTSKSFDDLHQHLGSDIPTANFQLNPSHINSNKAATGPATDALNRQQNSYLNGKNRTEEEIRGMPQPAIFSVQNNGQGGMATGVTDVTADAYAMFAQQSALAVSQHSAYCRIDTYPNSAVPPVAGTKRIISSLGPDMGFFTQNHMNGSRQRDSQKVAVIVDDSNTTAPALNGQESSSSNSCTSSVVNTANLKAHTNAMKAKARQEQQSEQDESSSSSSDSSSVVQRHHHRSQKRPRISSTTTTYLPSAHANLVSSSDRSGSEIGTETESALGSSHGSSTGSGSGSDNGSGSGSDNGSGSGSDNGSGSGSDNGSGSGSDNGSGSGSDNGSDNASDHSDVGSYEDGVAKPASKNLLKEKRCSKETQGRDCTKRDLISTHNTLSQAKSN